MKIDFTELTFENRTPYEHFYSGNINIHICHLSYINNCNVSLNSGCIHISSEVHRVRKHTWSIAGEIQQLTEVCLWEVVMWSTRFSIARLVSISDLYRKHTKKTNPANWKYLHSRVLACSEKSCPRTPLIKMWMHNVTPLKIITQLQMLNYGGRSIWCGQQRQRGEII